MEHTEWRCKIVEISQRPEYIAAQIQRDADYGMSPERLAYRETMREKVKRIIAGKALELLDKLEGDPEREF